LCESRMLPIALGESRIHTKGRLAYGARKHQGGGMAEDDNDLNEDMLEPSESVDSDELGDTVGDAVAEPPDEWAGADRIGTTAEEERAGETLDERLADEQPDIQPVEQTDRPSAAVAPEDLDETVDDVMVPGEPVDGEDISYD